MKATIFDGHTTRAFTAADHDIVSADTPFGWIDVCADGPDDPQVAPFLASLGFSDILAAYTSRSDGLGLFQQFDNNLVGATWAMPDEGNEPVIVHLVWNPARLVTVRAGANKAMASVTQQIDARGTLVLLLQRSLKEPQPLPFHDLNVQLPLHRDHQAGFWQRWYLRLHHRLHGMFFRQMDLLCMGPWHSYCSRPQAGQIHTEAAAGQTGPMRSVPLLPGFS